MENHTREELTPEQISVFNRIECGENLMGNNLKIPYEPNNSGSRKQMAFNQTTHVLNAVNCDVPYLSTGYETLFALKSSAFITAEYDYDVIAILHKFDNNKKIHYYLIVKQSDGDLYDIIEREEAINTTELYGYKFNNEYLDSKVVGPRQIRRGDVIKKTNAMDEYNNRGGGINLLCGYIQNTGNEEDAIIISESAHKNKLKYNLVHKVQVVINENDIPLNLYGDDINYKVIPDCGEDIIDSTLIGIRRVVNNEILFSQSYDRLKMPQVSDDIYYTHGKVVDIEVLCNNPSLLDTPYYSQLKKYYNYSITFSKSIVDCVDNLIKTNPNYKLSYLLDKMYNESKKLISGQAILSQNKKFSNMIVNILVIQESNCTKADKMSDRFGGKGEIAKIVPDNQMPKLADGTTLDIILNPPSIVKRQNLGTIIEPTINMATKIILDKIREYKTSDVIYNEYLDMSFKLILDFLEIVSPSEAETFNELLNEYNSMSYENMIDHKFNMLESILEYDCLHISNDPYTSINLDIIEKIKNFLPEIEDQYYYYDVPDSNGNMITKRSSRPITVGYKYMYIMKQLGSIDHAAVSLSTTGPKGDNIKSKNKKKYKSPTKETPIRFGEMEIMNMIHISKEVYSLLNIYSSSSQGRRSLKEALLTDDIFNFSLKSSPKFKNRQVEILNAYFSAMGIKLNIKPSNKKPKLFLQFSLVDMFDYGDNQILPFKSVLSHMKEDRFTIKELDGIEFLIDKKFLKENGWVSRKEDE